MDRCGGEMKSAVIATEVIKHLLSRRDVSESGRGELEIGLLCGEVQDGVCYIRCAMVMPAEFGWTRCNTGSYAVSNVSEVLDEEGIRKYVGNVQNALCGLTIVVGIYSILSECKEMVEYTARLVSMTLSSSRIVGSVLSSIVVISMSANSMNVFLHGADFEKKFPYRTEEKVRRVVDVSTHWNVSCFIPLSQGRGGGPKTIREIYQLVEKAMVSEIERIKAAVVVNESTEVVVDESSSSGSSTDLKRRKGKASRDKNFTTDEGVDVESGVYNRLYQKYRFLSVYDGSCANRNDSLVHQSATGILRIEGAISGHARVSLDRLDADAAAALKFDLVRTLLSRIDYMFEDGVCDRGLEMREHPIDDFVFVECWSCLPRRVMLLVEEMELAQCLFCGYVIDEEDLGDCLSRFCSLLRLLESKVKVGQVEDHVSQNCWPEMDLAFKIQEISRRGKSEANKRPHRTLFCAFLALMTVFLIYYVYTKFS